MLHPVGGQPQSVYWRRRIAVLAVVALAFLTMYAFIFRGSGKHKTAAAPSAHSSTRPASASPAVTTSPSPSPSGSPTPSMCLPAQLSVAASTSAKSYPVGSKPTVSLVVTNAGPAACVADLSDGQIDLRVLSGAARVWDSHDCAAQAGQSLQTLVVGTAVRRDVAWSGLSSQAGCAGQRQRVPAGSYSLIAIFAGKQSAPAPFSFTS